MSVSKRKSRAVSLAAAVSAASLALGSGSSFAQESPETIEEIIVFGDLIYKTRTEKVTPVIDYDSQFFQRFEPISVGDAVKRLPGVVFSDEINEYESIQLRGLAPEFTQVLVNGRRVPGGGNNRAFLIDRVPAELIGSISIVRSPSADMPSDGVAGSVDIQLRDPESIEGGWFRGGLLNYEDDTTKGAASLAFGTSSGDVNMWGAIDVQERHFVKDRVILFQDPEDMSFLGQREEEADERDSRDVSANFVIDFPYNDADIKIRGLIVSTDQDESESAYVFEENEEGVMELVEVKGQTETNEQLSYQLEGEADIPTENGNIGLYLGYAYFDDDLYALGREAGAGDPLEPVETEAIDTEEDSVTAEIFYSTTAGDWDVKTGVQLLRQNRDTLFRVTEFEEGVEEVVEESIFDVEELRIDPYIKGNLVVSDQFEIELGLRVETVSRDISGATFDVSSDNTEFNPSFHATYRPSEQGQFRFSLAKTVRNPNYDQLVPVELPDVPADDDVFRGNPNLEPETSWGVDLGYEHEIGELGLLGINVFYRDIDGLIDVVAVGQSVEGIQPFTADNVGDAKSYGFEMDIDVPLDGIGLTDTGLFANYSRLKSSVEDPITGKDRQYRTQASWVYNVRIMKNLTNIEMAMGATYNRRSSSQFGDFGELVDLKYGGILDLFIEKRFETRGGVIRLSATNVLDAKQTELLRVFSGDTGAEIRDSIRAGDVSDIEYQRDVFGPVIQLTGRISF